jgi:hypothetical protein
MALALSNSILQQSSSANPATSNVTISYDERLLVLMLVVRGASNRTGGAPLFAGVPMVQANTVQKAASSPEVSAELWYMLNPPFGTWQLSIPNSGAQTMFFVLATARSTLGGKIMFDAANGANATSTNPSVNVTVSEPNGIIFAVVGSGANTWAPTARSGVQIQDVDNGNDGAGYQYMTYTTGGTKTVSWTFGTSDDWGLVAAAFKEVPPHNLNGRFSVTVQGVDSISVNERIL